MEMLSALQIVFDAVLLFGVLFVFHYSVNQAQKKNEDAQIIKDLRVDEIRENLQELLSTLEQLGKEVSDNLQEKVREAEAKTEKLKKMAAKMDKDLSKVVQLSEVIEHERERLMEKEALLRASREIRPASPDVRGIEELALRSLPASSSATPVAGGERTENLPTSGSFSPKVLREVYRLADKKSDLRDIAQKTQLSRAEVQLILNLRGNRFSTPN